MANINILGLKYEIRYGDIMRDYQRWAEVNYPCQTITVDKSLSKDRAAIAVLHEAIHVVLETLGFETENENEHLVQCLAYAMHQLFKHNNQKEAKP